MKGNKDLESLQSAQKDTDEKSKRWWALLIRDIAIIIAILIIVRMFISPVNVVGTSMENTLSEGNLILTEKLLYRGHEKIGDIVTMKSEDDTILGGELLVKRVIGLPGDTVEAKNGIVYVNGEKLDEPYAKGLTPDIEKTKIEEGYIFLLGDNRENSLDSSELGPMRRSGITGHPFFSLRPFGKEIYSGG
jgi:signal peptidase I